ncbi:MAG: histidine kinase dimerization/phosphoacceptor domain -containing protein [Bacteroidota bacterium]
MKFVTLLLYLYIMLSDAMAQDINAIKNNGQTNNQKADSIFKYARKYFQQGKFDIASQWLDEGIALVLPTNNDTLIAQFFVDKGNVFNMQGQPTKALPWLWQAKAKLERTLSYYNLNSCYLLLAKSHSRLDNADSTLYYHRKNEDLNNTYNPYRNWLTYLEMGTMFATMDNFNESEKYFEKAYALTRQRGARLDHGLSIYHLSNFYFKRNKADKFAFILNEQQEFNKASKSDLTKDPIHSFLFIDWGKTPFPERIDFLKNVRQKLISEGFLVNGALVNEEIAIMYEDAKQYDEALKYVEESRKLSEKERFSSNIYMYTKIAYRILKKAGRYEEASQIADKLFALKDSIDTKQNIEYALELDKKYLTERKEKEIALLNSQTALNEKDIALLNLQNEAKAKQIALLNSESDIRNLELLRQQEFRRSLQRENLLQDSIVEQQRVSNSLLANENQLKNSELQKEAALKAALGRENNLNTARLKREQAAKWGFAAGAALLLLSGIAILILYQKQKKKNAIIQKQSADLEVLMKEIHHRVKNNLQIVSSLLDLQSHTITDMQASAAIKEGKNRVQSMALIHQNLYSEGNIKGIRIKEYISNLVQTLCDSYSITNDKVKINADIDDLNLDVDTMIPLGLVLNELVSNAFKYAFNEGKRGELNILLQEKEDKLNLKVSDNGIGFPVNMDVKGGKSFGLKMIRAFAQKLKAKLDIYNNNGAVVEMQITKFKTA